MREKIAGRALLLDPALRRRPAVALRLPRRARPRPSPPPAERRGAPAGAARRRLPADPGTEPARADRHRRRGPALDRRGERGAAGRAARLGRGHADAGDRQLPPRIRATPGPVRPTTTRSRSSRWARRAPRELLRDLAGERPVAGRPRRADPRAHRGQSVLHRGDRPRAGRERLPRGRARRLPAGPAGRGRSACRPPCRPCWRRGSTGSNPRRSGCSRRPRWPARRSASDRLPSSAASATARRVRRLCAS